MTQNTTEPEPETLEELVAIADQPHDVLRDGIEHFINTQYDRADWSMTLTAIHLEWTSPSQNARLHTYFMGNDPDQDSRLPPITGVTTATLEYVDTNNQPHTVAAHEINADTALYTELQGRWEPYKHDHDNATNTIKKYLLKR